MVQIIKTQQPQTTQTTAQPQVKEQPVQTSKVKELEEQVAAYQSQAQVLADKLYLANLRDDVGFRIEMLTQLNQIAVAVNGMTLALQGFLNKLEEGATQEQEGEIA